MQIDSEDPAAKLTWVMAKMKLAENEVKNNQYYFDNAMKALKAIEHELLMSKETVKKYINDYQLACQEIKELKEKVKGNISLI